MKLKSIQEMSSTFAETVSSQVNALKEGASAFINAIKEESTQFTQSLSTTAEATQAKQLEGVEHLRTLASRVSEKAEAGSSEFASAIQNEFNTLADKICVQFKQLTESSTALVEAQKRLVTDVESRTTKELEAADVLANNISEAATLMRVNRSEFAASRVLRRGLETVIEKLLAIRQNMKMKIISWNNCKPLWRSTKSKRSVDDTRKDTEILLEVLEQAQRVSAASNVKSRDNA